MEKGQRVREFFQLEAKIMLERYRVIETLLPSDKTRGGAHAGEEGRYIEAIVRAFLNKHLPSHLKAVSGFIIRPSTKTGATDLRRVESSYDKHSKQLDIIVYNYSAFPIYEQFEELAIVPIEGVVAVISVKKTLYLRQLAAELESLRSVVELCREDGKRAPFTGIFCFASEERVRVAEKAFDTIEEFHRGHRYDEMVTELSVLSKFTIFKFRECDSKYAGSAQYVNINTVDRSHIGLQRMLNSILSVFYDPTRGGALERPGFVSFEKGTFNSAPCLGFVKFLATTDGA